MAKSSLRPFTYKKVNDLFRRNGLKMKAVGAGGRVRFEFNNGTSVDTRQRALKDLTLDKWLKLAEVAHASHSGQTEITPYHGRDSEKAAAAIRVAHRTARLMIEAVEVGAANSKTGIQHMMGVALKAKLDFERALKMDDKVQNIVILSSRRKA